MELSHGGRVTLRLSDSGEGHVEYEGELAISSATWPTRARVELGNGAVQLTSEGTDPAPPWLVQFARATLRTAWRSNRTGAAWPRRVNRWRDPEC